MVARKAIADVPAMVRSAWAWFQQQSAAVQIGLGLGVGAIFLVPLTGNLLSGSSGSDSSADRYDAIQSRWNEYSSFDQLAICADMRSYSPQEWMARNGIPQTDLDIVKRLFRNNC